MTDAVAPDQKKGRQGILSLAIRDKSSLYAAYMPYVINGGLFVPTTKTYGLGDEVFMLVSIMESKERLPISGKVIWLTPNGAQGGKTPGIGIQFSSLDKGATKKRIENELGGSLASDRQTHTM